MKINSKEQQGVQVVEVSGDIDFHTSRDLREKFQQILNNKGAKLLVNLKKVNYIDSSGLATFVEALQHVKQSGGKLVLVGLAPAVRGVFEIAKLDSIFSLSDSEEKALLTLSQ